jgi:hypothetical protein
MAAYAQPLENPLPRRVLEDSKAWSRQSRMPSNAASLEKSVGVEKKCVRGQHCKEGEIVLYFMEYVVSDDSGVNLTEFPEGPSAGPAVFFMCKSCHEDSEFTSVQCQLCARYFFDADAWNAFTCRLCTPVQQDNNLSYSVVRKHHRDRPPPGDNVGMIWGDDSNTQLFKLGVSYSFSNGTFTLNPNNIG